VRIFNYGTGRIEEINDLQEQIEANKLIDKGEAVRLDLPELDNFKKKADELHDKFIAERERVLNEESPLYTEEVKEFEINRLEEEYREESAEVEAEYKAWREQVRKEAEVKAAQATVRITKNDKETAERFANRARLELLSGEPVGAIVDQIGLLTDEQRTALQAHIPALVEHIDEEDSTGRQTLIQAVKSVKNEQAIAVKVAEQLPVSVLEKMRIRDAARKAVRG